MLVGWSTLEGRYSHPALAAGERPGQPSTPTMQEPWPSALPSWWERGWAGHSQIHRRPQVQPQPVAFPPSWAISNGHCHAALGDSGCLGGTGRAHERDGGCGSRLVGTQHGLRQEKIWGVGYRQGVPPGPQLSHAAWPAVARPHALRGPHYRTRMMTSTRMSPGQPWLEEGRPPQRVPLGPKLHGADWEEPPGPRERGPPALCSNHDRPVCASNTGALVP